jgi:KUP system potassium uptake protein
VRGAVQDSWARTLMLAFQSIGVVYGDIGTSPLYVYSSTFPDGIRHPDDLLGVLSLILYTLILIPMLKYVFVVLHANDNGDGELACLLCLLACGHIYFMDDIDLTCNDDDVEPIEAYI